MDLSFLGGSQTVTGSKYLIEDFGKKILVDSGLFQGYKELRQRNWAPFPVDPKSLDCVLLTHAHIDHTGHIPLLVKQGFRKSIYCSKGTQALCSILLPDSGHLQEEEAFFLNKHGLSKHQPALPLYTREDAINSLHYFHPLEFGKLYNLFDEFTISLHRAGHILGASFVLIKNESTSILFSGDLGRTDDLIMPPPVHMSGADYIVVESTYGDRLHGTQNPLDEVSEIITRTAKRGGSIIIPSFAVGRTQTVLYILYQLLNAKRIPNIPIYVDSPLAKRATQIYCENPHELRLNKDLIEKVCGIAKYVETVEESKYIDNQQFPKIIISASGMASGGRVLHHLLHHLGDHRNSVIFAGFQVPGTRGDRLVRGEQEIKIFGQETPVNAEIIFLDSLSAHADANGIMEWLKSFTQIPRKVFLVHGEEEAASALKERIERELGWPCAIPAHLTREVI